MTQRAFFFALLLVAANLRPALTGVGSLLKTIQEELALSATAAGLLGGLPVLIFALFAPLARLARQLGAERVVLVGLLLLTGGVLLRSAGNAGTLFIGTTILAIGIASTNVLIPVIIRQHYPERVPAITTAYASVMGGVAAIASGVSVPMAEALSGWRISLAAWAAPALLAMIVWLPHTRAEKKEAHAPEDLAPSSPWRTRVAWQVTGFMGLQSTIFYVAISWFPSVLRDEGFSAAAAGWLLTLYQVAALIAGLIVPWFVRILPNQRALAFGVAFLSALGILGILFIPRFAVAWMVLLGCGSGPSLILALSFMGLRAGSSRSAAALSLMAQGIGYFLAALGPVVFGLIHDFSGHWDLPLLCVAGIALGQGLCGIGAGRAIKV